MKYPPYQVYPEDTVSRYEIFDGDIKENTNDTKTPQKKEIVEKQKEPKTDYEKAKAKENKETKYVKLYSRKVTNARNILVRDGSASADVIVDFYDISPFGRILIYTREGYHDIYTISLVYYQDKWWVIKDMDD